MKNRIKNIILLVLMLIFQVGYSCSKRTPKNKEVPLKTEVSNGIRIAWDYSTLTRIAPKANRPAGYYGYSRMIQLKDRRLACVYETSFGNIELVFSSDLGKTWGEPKVIFSTQNNIAMAVPEIIQLSDQSVLIACNPRPREPYTEDRRFGIKVRKSKDLGETWQPEQVVYEAQKEFENGCWEPSFVQLPNGEVQVFFANEGIYNKSSEQNISMFRSTDFGESWSSKPEIIGFRNDRRDGMPVPLLLPDKGLLLVAIEDNKIGEFKPTIYREKLTDNWTDGTITANDPRREYQPLKNPLPNEIYAGGPYLARLETGEVLLSYQSNLNRNAPWNQSAMAVEIGDDSGTSFDRRSWPFSIPIDKWGLWNSIAVIENNTPVAITSTNAFSPSSTEVWMITGHVIPELELPIGTANIDVDFNDDCWNGDWPYFVGHKSEAHINAAICADGSNLYLAAKVANDTPKTDTKYGQENGVIFQLDAEREGYTSPQLGIFSFHLKANGSLKVYEGNVGEWKEIDAQTVQFKTQKNDNSYQIEMAVPLSLFGTKWNETKSKGINLTLNNTAENGTQVIESINLCEPEKPFTWCPLYLK